MILKKERDKPMKINTIILEKALNGLNEVLVLKKDDIIRDSAIQRFEYTYELSIKLLRRQLEEMADVSTEIDHLSYRDLIRMGAEKGLINNPVLWFDFREKRNITSHTYDEARAEEVYKVLPVFAEESLFLLNSIKNRN